MKTVEEVTGLKKPTFEDYLKEQKEKRKMENNYKEKYEELIKNYQDFKETVINSLESLKGQEIYDYDFGYNCGVEENIAVVADMNVPSFFDAEQKPFFLLTRLEYELLKYWKDKGYKYIARDRDVALYIYKEEPSKDEDMWFSKHGRAIRSTLFDDLFHFIEWTDEYPFNIEELINTSEVVEND